MMLCSTALRTGRGRGAGRPHGAQNASDPRYRPLTADSLAFQAARAPVFGGTNQPNGYTKPLLHAFRARVKQADVTPC